MNKKVLKELSALYEIRKAIGDPYGKLMQSEVVDSVNKLQSENAQLRELVERAIPFIQDHIGDGDDSGIDARSIHEAYEAFKKGEKK